ncbi:hypothetical protein V5799_000157 [Amblyomma americanum]|uniref:Uncharacterized protein n=1 Tax=Amblyomma americanum TaxID=6943 RepID=A0AAQ4D3U6_AMBAM
MEDLSQGTALRLCAHCVRLCEEPVGKPTRPHQASPEQLLDFVRRLFADVFEAHGESAIRQRAAALLTPRLQLSVGVVQADGLREPADTFVCAWLEPDHKANTSVRCNSASPRWDEQLLLDVPEDWRRAQLNVELWRRGRGWRPRQLVGRVFQPLADLPCVAVDRWEPLAGGRLRLRLELRGSEQPAEATRDHVALSRLFLADGVARAGDRALEWIRWEDCLEREPLTLLRQHALQWGLGAGDEAACRLLAATAARTSHGRLSYRVLQALLQELKAESPPDAALREVEAQTRGLLGRLHDAFCLRDVRQALDLLGVLSCCSLCESLGGRPVGDCARQEVLKSARRWHLQLAVLGLRDATHDSFVADLGRVLLLLGQFHGAADAVFRQAWNQSYTEITARELDCLLEAHVRPRVVSLCTLARVGKGPERDRLVQRSLDSFQLLRAFVGAVGSQLPAQRPPLAMDAYTNWFGAPLVIEWFEMARKPLLASIPAAVDSDSLVPCGGRAGSSARYAADAIEQRLVCLWTNLDWPQPEVARRFALLVSECALLFAQSTERRARRQRFFATANGLVSTRLCVAVSNVEALLPTLALVQESILRCFDARPEWDDSLADLCAPVKRAAESVGACARRLADGLLREAQPELGRLLTAAVRCSGGPAAQERALLALAAHLNACLSALHAHLDKAAFGNALLRLWQGLLDSASRLHRARFRRNRPEQASALLDALRRMRKIVYADGAGLAAHQVDCDLYRQLERGLSLRNDAAERID